MTRRKVDLAELRRLHDAGLSGAQIAAALGVAQYTVSRCRLRLGLPRPGRKVHDLGGRTFGFLRADARIGFARGRGSLWQCVCRCGARVCRYGPELLTGRATSCGCAPRERAGMAEVEARREAVRAMRASGRTLAEIAARLGVSRQRAHQICFTPRRARPPGHRGDDDGSADSFRGRRH
jgi:hypothetical protein